MHVHAAGTCTLQGGLLKENQAVSDSKGNWAVPEKDRIARLNA